MSDKYLAPWGTEYESPEQAVAAMGQYATELQTENARLTGVLQATSQHQQAPAAPPPPPTNQVTGRESAEYSYSRDDFLKEMVQGDPAEAVDKLMKQRVFKNANLPGSFMELMAANAGRLQQLEAMVLESNVKGKFPEIDIQNKGIQEEIKKLQQENGLAPHQIDAAVKIGQGTGRLPTREHYQAWVQQQLGGMVQQQQEAAMAQQAADNPMMNPQWQPQPIPVRYQQQPVIPIAPPSMINRGGGAPALNPQEFIQMMQDAPNAAAAKKLRDQYLPKVG